MNTEDTRTTGIDVVEPTVEDCLRELREMFPDALRLYVSEDADYFDGGKTLDTCMAQVRAWKQEQEKSNA